MPQRISGFSQSVFVVETPSDGQQVGQQVGITRVRVTKFLIGQKEPMRGQVQNTRRLHGLQLCFSRFRSQPQDAVTAKQFCHTLRLGFRPWQRLEFQTAIITAQ